MLTGLNGLSLGRFRGSILARMESVCQPETVEIMRQKQRFEESKLLEQPFEQIVRQRIEVGLVQGRHLSADVKCGLARSMPMDAMCMTMILPAETAELCYSAADHLISRHFVH